MKFLALSLNQTPARFFQHLKLMIFREPSYWNQVEYVESEPPQIIFEVVEDTDRTSATSASRSYPDDPFAHKSPEVLTSLASTETVQKCLSGLAEVMPIDRGSKD